MSAWENCLQHLRTVFSERDLTRDLGSVRAEERKDRVVLLAPNHDTLTRVQHTFLSRIEVYFRDYETPPRAVELRVASAATAETGEPVPEGETVRNQLSSRLTFEHFVSGPSNALAERAALDIAKNPGGTSPNPLFVSGGHGLGKTHLLQAIAHEILRRAPNSRVLYVHGERFVEDAIRAMRSKDAAKLDAFKTFYRTADVLLVDDIWALEHTDHCLREFVHTLNALFERGAQVVIGAARLPHEMEANSKHAEVLKSRLLGGLHVVLNPPDFETRVRILLHKATERGAELPRECAEYIGKLGHGCVRGLENALCRVHMQALHEDTPITTELVRITLAGHIHTTHVGLPEIFAAVCNHFDCSADELRSASRRRSIVRPRQIAMTLCSDLTDLSLADIGDAFGGRDHSTVIYACRKIRTAQDADPDTWSRYQTLSRELQR